jgi:hypothetical protein
MLSKWPRPNSKHVFIICLEALRKSTKNFSQGIRSPGRVSNQVPLEYLTEALLIGPDCCCVIRKVLFHDWMQLGRVVVHAAVQRIDRYIAPGSSTSDISPSLSVVRSLATGDHRAIWRYDS